MSRRFWVLLMTASMATSGAMAAEPIGPTRKATAKSIAEQAARLVTELGSDDYTTREQAAHDLEALGPAAMPVLRPAVTSRDPEVRRLARQIAEKFTQQIEADHVLEPRRLRIAYRDIPLHVAVAEFQRVTGAQIRLDGAKTDRKVTFDTGYVAFWEAFDKFCADTGLTEKTYDSPADAGLVAGYPGQYGRRMGRWSGEVASSEDVLAALFGGQYVLTDIKPKTKPPARPTFQAGSLRIRALPAGTNLGRFSTFKGDRELVFGLEVLPDPTLGWDRVQSLQINRAIDEQGQPLDVSQIVTTTPPVSDEFDGLIIDDWGGPVASGNSGGQRLPLRLRMGRKPSTVIKELSGVLTIKMQSATEALATIDRVLETSERSVRAKGGSSLKITDLKREDDGKLTIQLKVEQADVAPNPWGVVGGIGNLGGIDDGSAPADGAVSTGNIVLFDARGHLVRLVSKEQIPDENGINEEYKFTYQLAKGQPPPTKLVLQGRRPLSLHVHFTLKDVPLKQTPGAAKSAPAPDQPLIEDGPISQTAID